MTRIHIHKTFTWWYEFFTAKCVLANIISIIFLFFFFLQPCMISIWFSVSHLPQTDCRHRICCSILDFSLHVCLFRVRTHNPFSFSVGFLLRLYYIFAKKNFHRNTHPPTSIQRTDIDHAHLKAVNSNWIMLLPLLLLLLLPLLLLLLLQIQKLWLWPITAFGLAKTDSCYFAERDAFVVTHNSVKNS